MPDDSEEAVPVDQRGDQAGSAVWILPELVDQGDMAEVTEPGKVTSGPSVRGDGARVAGLEMLLEQVNIGMREPAEVIEAVLAAPLLIYGRDTQDTALFAFHEKVSGELMVCAVTSPLYVPREWPAWREVRGHDLARELHGHPLLINPDGPVGAIVQPQSLLAALA